MARGGRRPGAGRKPKDTSAIVLSLQGERMASPPAYERVERPFVPSGDGVALVTPPEDLSEAEQAAWRVHAPLALAQDTLVEATVPGFRELCQLIAQQKAFSARIAVLGLTSSDADRLLKRWEKGAVLLNGKLKDFKLTAFGKPEVASIRDKKPKANPWASLAQK